MKRALLAFLFTAVSIVTLTFLALPIIAIFARTTPGHLLDQFSNPRVRDAFILSLKTSPIAQAFIILFGTPTAYFLSTRRFRGHAVAIALVELPLILPPAVAGIGLLAAFGRLGLLGSTFEALGISLPFTQTAVTIAVAYVASPLYIRPAIAA